MARPGGVNGKSITITLVGVVLAYSGVKGRKVSTTVRDLIAGHDPTKSTQTDLPITVADAQSQQTLGDVLTGPLSGDQAPVVAGAPGSRAAQNQAIARPLARAMGWNDSNGEWAALVQLWNNESGWNNTAYNPASGATGIPQAVPGSKMGPFANAPYYDPHTQIVWGLGYIKMRYGSPSRALTFWNRTDPRPYPGHWY